MKKQTVDAGHGERDMRNSKRVGGGGRSIAIKYLA